MAETEDRSGESESDFDEGDFPDGECICCGQAFNAPDEECFPLDTIQYVS